MDRLRFLYLIIIPFDRLLSKRVFPLSMAFVDTLPRPFPSAPKLNEQNNVYHNIDARGGGGWEKEELGTTFSLDKKLAFDFFLFLCFDSLEIGTHSLARRSAVPLF